MYKLSVAAILLAGFGFLFGAQERDYLSVKERLVAIAIASDNDQFSYVPLIAIPVATACQSAAEGLYSGRQDSSLRGEFNVAATKTARSNDDTLANFLITNKPSLPLTAKVENYIYWLERSVNKSGDPHLSAQYLPGYKKAAAQLAAYKSQWLKHAFEAL